MVTSSIWRWKIVFRELLPHCRWKLISVNWVEKFCVSYLYRLENTLVVVTSQRPPASWSAILPGCESLEWHGFRSLFKENVSPSRGTGLSTWSSQLGSSSSLPRLGVDVVKCMTQTRTTINFTIVVAVVVTIVAVVVVVVCLWKRNKYKI